MICHKLYEVTFLTGYKIDGLPNQQYRLSPIYAESPHDHLIFRRDSDGECHVVS